MAFDRDYTQTLAFDLTGDDEGGIYRVPMTNAPGELNRRVMVNRSEKFQVLADLLDVVHGTTKDGGDDATLLIAIFHFLPPADKRFVEARIDWTFTSDDPAIEVSVEKIAPQGAWSFSPTRQAWEKNLVGRASVGPAVGPVTANVEGEFGMKQTMELDDYTRVTGSMLNLNRDCGGHDAARWVLSENKLARTGVCRMLQVGVLLKRRVLSGQTPKPGPAPKFRGELEVVVTKNGLSEVASKAKRAWKRTEKDQAVVFQAGKDLVSGNFRIDKNNLGSMHLEEDVMFMSLHESFDKIREERDERARRKREKLEAEKESREVPAATASSSSATPPTQGTPPVWVLYFAAGVIAVYLWQQLTRLLFGGN